MGLFDFLFKDREYVDKMEDPSFDKDNNEHEKHSCQCCCKCKDKKDDEYEECYVDECVLNCVKARDNAELPSYAHYGDAGCDVKVSSFVKFYNQDNTEVKINEEDNVTEFVLKPGQRLLIGTGIKADLPKKIGFYIAIRSGLSTKHGIMCVNAFGVIDHIYKGEICLPVINMSSVPYTFHIGDRVGQLLPFQQIKLRPYWVDELGKSSRDNNGFGSSGI